MELDLKPIKLLGNLNAKDLWPTLNIAMLGWALLAFAPRWKYTKILTLLPPIFHALIYSLTLISLILTESDASADFFSLEGVVAMFKDPTTVFAGWVHYVVFDLLIGRGIVLDSVARDVGIVGHVVFIVPCLFFTLMSGPFGFLLYVIISNTLLPAKQTKDKKM